MKRYGGWLVLLVLLTLGGTYSGVIYHTSEKIGGGYESGDGLSIQDDGKVQTTSTIQGTQLISTVATGTPPLVAASTTVVPNLYVARAQLADLATRATTADSATTNFDISDDTNLSAGSGIVLTGDALSHDTTAGYKHVPTGGTAGQALLATGVSGTGAWSGSTGAVITPLPGLAIGGGYEGLGYTNANGDDNGLTITGTGALFTNGDVVTGGLYVYGGPNRENGSPYALMYENVTPSTQYVRWFVDDLASNRDYHWATDEGGYVVVAPTKGTATQLLSSDGDGTYSWTSAGAAVGNVEDLATAGGAGTAPVSDGAGGLDMADIVTQTELGSYEPTLGTNTAGNYVASMVNGLGITGGSAGSEGAALTLALEESGVTTAGTDHTMDANTEKFGANGIIFEGATADTIEGYLKPAAMSGTDPVWTLPNLTGTVALTGAAQTVSFGSGSFAGLTAVSAGATLVSNGTFDTVTTGWTQDHATLSIVSAALRVTKDAATTSGTGYQIVSGLTAGRRYKFTYTIVDYDGGDRDAYIVLGDGSTFYNASFLNTHSTTPGTYTVYATATTTSMNIGLRVYSPTSAAGYVTYDNVSLCEAGDITASGDLTISGNSSVVGTGSFARVNTTGGVHVGGTSDPGTDNLIVDGTGLVSGVLSLGTTPVAVNNAAGKLLWAAMETPTIKRTIVLTAAGGEPTSTAGCAASAVGETTTNKRCYRHLDFDPDTDESAFWNVTTIPDDYPTGGTFVVNIKWKAAGTGNVTWYASAVATGHDDVYDAANGTAVSVTTAVTAAGDELESTTSAMTAAGSPQAGDSLYIKISRDGDGSVGSDTVAGDVELLGASLDYTPKYN